MNTTVTGTVTIEFYVELDENYSVTRGAQWADDAAENMAIKLGEDLKAMPNARAGRAKGYVRSVEVKRP